MTCHDARERLSDLLDDALEAEARAQVDAHLAGCAGVPARARSPQGHGLAAPRRRAAAGPGRLRRPRARGRAPGPLASAAPRLARRRPAPPISRRGRRGGARGLARRLRLPGDARAADRRRARRVPQDRRRRQRPCRAEARDGRATGHVGCRPNAGTGTDNGLGTGPVEVPSGRRRPFRPRPHRALASGGTRGGPRAAS